MIYLDKTESPDWFALDAKEPQSRAFIRSHMTLFGSRRVGGKISLVIEAKRVDGFLRFCQKMGIKVDLET